MEQTDTADRQIVWTELGYYAGDDWPSRDHGEGEYLVLDKITHPDGAVYYELSSTHPENQPEEIDLILGSLPALPSFRVSAAKILRTRRASNYASELEIWPERAVRYFGKTWWHELGTTDGERRARWLARRRDYLAAGLIPAN